jgi:hypothetical protein
MLCVSAETFSRLVMDFGFQQFQCVACMPDMCNNTPWKSWLVILNHDFCAGIFLKQAGIAPLNPRSVAPCGRPGVNRSFLFDFLVYPILILVNINEYRVLNSRPDSFGSLEKRSFSLLLSPSGFIVSHANSC